MAKISSFLLEELKRHEGVRPQVYDDITSKPVASYSEVKGAPTIAMGKKIQEHEKEVFKSYLKGKKELRGEELNKVIRETIEPREQKLAGVIKVPVTQSMFDSLFSFAFNTGFGAKPFKAVLEKLNKGDYKGAQQAIASGPQTSAGKKLPGLVKRRAFEASHFMSEGLPQAGSALAGVGSWDELRNRSAYGGSIQAVSPLGARIRLSDRSVGVVPFVFGASGAFQWGIYGALLGAIVPSWTAKEGLKKGALAGGVVGFGLGTLMAVGVIGGITPADKS